MHKIQVDIPNELAQKLSPYQEHLPELLELGLQVWKKRHQADEVDDHKRVRQVLRSSEQVTLPEPHGEESSYIRHTPVSITGKSVSEIVIEQRFST